MSDERPSPNNTPDRDERAGKDTRSPEKDMPYLTALIYISPLPDAWYETDSGESGT